MLGYQLVKDAATNRYTVVNTSGNVGRLRLEAWAREVNAALDIADRIDAGWLADVQAKLAEAAQDYLELGRLRGEIEALRFANARWQQLAQAKGWAVDPNQAAPVWHVAPSTNDQETEEPTDANNS